MGAEFQIRKKFLSWKVETQQRQCTQYHLKRVKPVNFVLSVFYHNKRQNTAII